MFDVASPDDFKASNAAKMDEALLVRFFHKEREDEAKTRAEGIPSFKEVEYVEIRVAGQRDAQACRPATFRDKQRFSRHYEAFQRRVEVPEEGTLLKEWPQISRSQVEELSYFNVKTVEQLATVGDTHISKIRGGAMLKSRAAQWLESTGEVKLIAEKEALQARLADMEQKLAEMQEYMARQQPTPQAEPEAKTEVKTKPDRPRRASRSKTKPAEK